MPCHRIFHSCQHRHGRLVVLTGIASMKLNPPAGKSYRMSPDSVWPLRCADGRTFADRKAQKERDGKMEIDNKSDSATIESVTVSEWAQKLSL